jgi:hypothetical protein
MFPDCGSVLAGVNVMWNVLACAGCSVALVGLTVNVPLLEATLLITRTALPVSITVTLSGLFWPRGTNPNVTVLLLSTKPGGSPVPLTATVSGELDALWVKTMFPVCVVAFAGVNVIKNFALAAAAIEAAVGLTVNDPLPDVTLLIVSVVVPAFLTMTLSLEGLATGIFPKATNLRSTENPVPVPLTATVSRTVGALCAKTMFPFWRPFAVGVNVMVNALRAPGCIVPAAGFTENRAFVDVTPLITSGAVPVFVTATLSGFPVAITTNP